jgi:glutamyl-tRNA reductase
MKFLVTGLNHRTAPVEVRERLAFDEGKLAEALDELKRRPGLLEGMILSTCNRVEIAVTTDEQTNAEECIEEFLADSQHVSREWVSPYLYHHQGPDAIRHLFRVAASLDSMVVGEPQILGQLKAAYTAAKETGAVSGFLEMVLSRAFNVAKRVRSETDIGQSAVSVSYAAVELAREIFGSLSDKKVLLVGAGKMSELSARHLRRSGVGQIFVTNRTYERAVEMAKVFEGRIVDYEKFVATLPEVDIVIASSGAPHYILTKDKMRKVIEARRNRPMFLIDIAVPRNIEPSVNELDNVFLYDIDDLQKVVDLNVKGRQRVAEEAEEIIAEEVQRMMSRLKEREVAPMIVSLQEQLEQVRLSEMERMRGKLGNLTPQQQEAIDALTRGIINKIAHGPISELRKQASSPDGAHFASVIRRVFRLGASQ